MTRKPSKPSDKQHKREAPTPRGGTSSMASKPSPKTTTAARGADGSTTSQRQQPDNVQESTDDSSVVQMRAEPKDGEGKGQFSLSDQALKALQSTINDPTASVAARNDAASKILQYTKGEAEKGKQINGLSRDELRREIAKVRAMLA